MNTNELLDAAKIKLNLDTDYKLAKHLNARRSLIGNYRTGLSAPDELTCFKLAEILELEPQAVIAAVRAETEKDENKKRYWREMSLRYSVALSIIVISNLVTINQHAEHLTYISLFALKFKDAV